ncbi:MAG: non-ribosomal peptide synthetase [Planctomycetota bacterium]|jgi:acyl-CoA synthetase (AMP-forming)/AMP-acid ligase II
MIILISGPQKLQTTWLLMHPHEKDRVAIVLPNGPEMATAFISVAAYCSSAPLNQNYRTKEYQFYLTDLHAKAVILPEGIQSPAREVAQELKIPIIELKIDNNEAGLFTLETNGPATSTTHEYITVPENEALVLHTSGTTALPKIVPLKQKNVIQSAENIINTLKITSEDRCLNIMPLFHIHGLIGALLSSITAGASIVCCPGFDENKFFNWIEALEPTWYTSVPTLHQAILAKAKGNPEILSGSHLRLIRSSSSSLPPQVMAELESLFNVPVIESYGMTEAAHQMSSNPLPPKIRKPGSVGLQAGPQVAVMDEAGNFLNSGEIGEIVIKGENVFSGYENKPEANRESFVSGWFRTGDQGKIDDEGYIFLTGRLKEIINKGGENISPREIDEVLMDHPQVVQAVAFAVPHPTLGEEVGVAIVTGKNNNLTPNDIRAFVKLQLADFKVPNYVVFVDEIPKGATGKLQRIGLAEKLLHKLKPQYTAPETYNEKLLADIWTELFGLEKVGIYDNFFSLGGDSLRATQVVSRVATKFNIQLPLNILFEVPTVAELSKKIFDYQLNAVDSEYLNVIKDKLNTISDEEASKMLKEEIKILEV